MTTRIVVTGTGSPAPRPGRAGPGVLIQHGDVALQVDAGRATSLRLAEAGVRPDQLSALLLTHHHYDHLTGVADIVLARWLGMRGKPDYFPILAPNGGSSRFVDRILDIWDEDIEVRQIDKGYRTRPAANLEVFRPTAAPQPIWEQGGVRVISSLVHHEPVDPAVAYRIEGPDGVVAVSGDTRECAEMEELSRDADVLVHEAMRKSVKTTGAVAYHTDTVALGALAARARVRSLILYHLLPTPATREDELGFEEDVRRGGFEGELVVARDLTEVRI